jgi:hypothetical protein
MKQIIFLLGLLPFFISCTDPFTAFFSDTQKISFLIPEDGSLLYLGEESHFGIPTAKVVHKDDIIELELPKNHCCPFVLISSSSTIYEKQGFVYPYDKTFIPQTDSIHLEASTYSAYIFLRLIELSVGDTSKIYERASQFNWRKFSQTVEKKIIENQNTEDYSPWNYNHGIILSRIADGSFTASCLK